MRRTSRSSKKRTSRKKAYKRSSRKTFGNAGGQVRKVVAVYEFNKDSFTKTTKSSS